MGRRVQLGIPRLYAAASLKPCEIVQHCLARNGIPRLYAAASLKRLTLGEHRLVIAGYSAALCRGLIEALQG